MTKRITALLLSVVLLVSAMVPAAFAAGTSVNANLTSSDGSVSCNAAITVDETTVEPGGKIKVDLSFTNVENADNMLVSLVSLFLELYESEDATTLLNSSEETIVESVTLTGPEGATTSSVNFASRGQCSFICTKISVMLNSFTASVEIQLKDEVDLSSFVIKPSVIVSGKVDGTTKSITQTYLDSISINVGGGTDNPGGSTAGGSIPATSEIPYDVVWGYGGTVAAAKAESGASYTITPIEGYAIDEIWVDGALDTTNQATYQAVTGDSEGTSVYTWSGTAPGRSLVVTFAYTLTF